MADNLPEPKSRKESYLAKAAGMDVSLPEAPESREELYLNAIAEGGGGGGTSDFDELTNRPKYNGTTMSSTTNIPEVKDVNEYVIKAAGAPTTSTEGTVGMVYEDTTNGKLYQCTAVSGDTYTWSEVGSGEDTIAKELTTDDYNWNSTAGSSTTEPFDCVAMWLLEPGVYTLGSGVLGKVRTGETASNIYQSYILTIGKPGSSYSTYIPIQIFWMNGANPTLKIGYMMTDGSDYVSTATISGSVPSVVQTTGTSTTNVMSQDAATSMVYGDPSTKKNVRIGLGASASTTGTYSGLVAIGSYANAKGQNSVAITASGAYSYSDNGIAIGSNAYAGYGTSTSLRGESNIAIGTEARAPYSSGDFSGGIAIGSHSRVNANHSLAIGSYAKTTEKGQFDISTLATTNTYGYNNSQYRLLTGLYDGSSAHDAATYGQLNTRLGGLTLLKISQTDYDNLGTYDPNTLYVITGA